MLKIGCIQRCIKNWGIRNLLLTVNLNHELFLLANYPPRTRIGAGLGRTASTRIIGRLAFVHGKAATKTNWTLKVRSLMKWDVIDLKKISPLTRSYSIQTADVSQQNLRTKNRKIPLPFCHVPLKRQKPPDHSDGFCCVLAFKEPITLVAGEAVLRTKPVKPTTWRTHPNGCNISSPRKSVKRILAKRSKEFDLKNHPQAQLL